MENESHPKPFPGLVTSMTLVCIAVTNTISKYNKNHRKCNKSPEIIHIPIPKSVVEIIVEIARVIFPGLFLQIVQ